jgi:ATP-dependent Lon protease
MFGQGINEFNVRDAEVDENGLIEAVLIPLRDLVVYPNMVTPLFVGRDRSLAAITAAQGHEETVIGVGQIDPGIPDPKPDDLYNFGTEMALGRLMRMPDGTTSVLAQGRRRVEIVEFTMTDAFYRVKARPVVEQIAKTRETEALMRAVLALFEKCAHLNPDLPEEAYIYALNVEEPGWLADLIASSLSLTGEERQSILEMVDPMERLHRISVLLGRELDVLELEEQINEQVQQEVDRNQREVFLRERMRVIQTELGEADPFQQEINDLRERIEKASMPEEVNEKALKELTRLTLMPQLYRVAGGSALDGSHRG